MYKLLRNVLLYLDKSMEITQFLSLGSLIYMSIYKMQKTSIIYYICIIYYIKCKRRA